MFVDNNIHEFLDIIKDKDNDKPLRNFKGLAFNLFEGISPDEFIKMFLKVKNCRKGEFLHFFSDRYEYKECLVADKDFIASLIPGLLILNAIQAERYMKVEREVRALEKKQVQLVEENKKLITDISLLSSGQRISNIAENELGMHKAESEEIVRVEMENKKK